MLSQEKQASFAAVRRRVIAQEFNELNSRQREGVLTTEGPLLLLAGAGSGKTTVLIRRIGNLLRYGRGSDTQEVPDDVTEADLAFLQDYETQTDPTEEERALARQLCQVDPARPWQVIAITFTNKAAGELKQRLEEEIGPEAQEVWAATFHSACVRILRRNIERLGFPSSFTIYDTDDSIRVLKDCIKERNLDDKVFQPRTVLGYISRAKDEMLLAEEYQKRCRDGKDIRQQKIADLYSAYQKKLWDAGALDFDDIIFHTVRLLQSYEDVRAYYQNKFRYVLIDEYQDTNQMQNRLASLLTGSHRNICVVGDDDQSIYRFRGATVENILSFEKEYRNTRVICLEQNYRSTGNILAAANAVIKNNRGRKGKSLWTDRGDGSKVQVHTAVNEREEGSYVARQLFQAHSMGRQWKDCAVLYRMNTLSNQIEMALKSNSIPYRVVGGFRFFERAEIKDMLSYLCVIHNPRDDLRLVRIINNPPRGIGAKTLELARNVAEAEDLSLWDVIREASRWSVLAKAQPKFEKFVQMIQSLQRQMEEGPLLDGYEALIQESGYEAMLTAKKDVESKTRLENVQELSSSINGYLQHAEDPSLGGFLDEVALYTDLDGVEDEDNCVTLMTMHAAKGLEYPVVFAVGMEEGVFPGFRSIGEEEELEEERRLCYVAMTRAKESLHLTCAAQRMLYGRTSANLPSRFVQEIPEELIERSGHSRQPERRTLWDDSWSSGTESFSQIPKTGNWSEPSGRTAYRKPAPKPKALPKVQAGDRVRHSVFGAGVVVSAKPVGGDVLMEVSFETAGTKRMMLKAASQFMTIESPTV